jgi:hypothetical protein
MADKNIGIDAEVAGKFNAIDSGNPISISLNKDDVALLISSLSELHKSYAAMLRIPFLTMRSDPEDVKINEESAKKSYDLFAQFANGLMARFVDEANK